MSIQEIIERAFQIGVLSIEAEAQLRQKLQRSRYGIEEVRAFAALQQAMMAGHIQQQSWLLAARAAEVAARSAAAAAPPARELAGLS